MTFERTMQIASRLIEFGGFFIADCQLPIASLVWRFS